jgi:serine/threonine protein kinase/formylglycine-generating enzyme required for sulfatase activity
MSSQSSEENDIIRQFEMLWNAGHKPCFADWLKMVPEEAQRALLTPRLIAIEIAQRLQRGETVQPESDYPQATPQQRELIEQAIRQLKVAGNEVVPVAPPSTLPLQLTKETSEFDGYKLLEKIGSGGMGEVWMAEQRNPVRRLVAIKLIRLGCELKPVVARFEAERQALAMMDHQNIARIFGAGTTPDGRPYFVMELVRGLPLTEYCDKNRLTPEQRLELFIPVCLAVQHAHQKGIIHRDLKPSNILVCQHDGKPTPKVIDFGLVKALHGAASLTPRTLFTAIGHVLGTLQYMSPEQSEPNRLDVDTRTDVYSLGVVLYELLTGTTPLRLEEFEKSAMVKILEAVRQDETPAPSLRISSIAAEAVAGICRQRQCQPARLQQFLKGDLDCIILKALDKDRDRRYASANEFADDIDSCLRGDVVKARPASAWYRLRRTMRRNRGLVLSFASILVAITLVVMAGYAATKQATAKGLAESLPFLNAQDISAKIQDADAIGSAILPLLQQQIRSANIPQTSREDRLKNLPARLVLVKEDKAQIPFVVDAMLECDFAWIAAIRERLRPYAEELRPEWLRLLRDANQSSARRFRAALGLAGLDGDVSLTSWTETDLRFIAGELASGFAEQQQQLRELLQPIGKQLTPALEELFDADAGTELRQVHITQAIAEFTGQSRLLELAREQPTEMAGQMDRVRLGRRRANAALALLRQGQRDSYFDVLRVTDDSESLSQFVHRCRNWGVTLDELLESLQRSRQFREAATVTPKQIEARVTYGLLLAIGNCELGQASAASLERLLAEATSLYEQDPSAAVHSASGWLLRHLGHGAVVDKLDESEVPYDPTGERDWFRWRFAMTKNERGEDGELHQGGEKQWVSLTFVVCPAGEYSLGSPMHELDRKDDEVERRVRISNPVALCDREVAWELFNAFDGGDWHKTAIAQLNHDLSPASPVVAVAPHRWKEFCRWLTVQRFGDDEGWQSYQILEPEKVEEKTEEPTSPEENDESSPWDMEADYTPYYETTPLTDMLLNRPGFRMPTEAEWESVATTGQCTAWAFGGDSGLMSEYELDRQQSDNYPIRSASKFPGIGGLFDIHGNVNELTDDWYGPLDSSAIIDDPRGALAPNSWKNIQSGFAADYLVGRGGFWDSRARECRLATRFQISPWQPVASLGLRLALNPAAKPSTIEKDILSPDSGGQMAR